MLIKLVNYFKGCLAVELHGLFLEKFVNMCVKRRIYLWDIEKISRDRLRLKMSVSGFKMTRPIARKTHTKARIYRRIGLPFLLHRYRRRGAFIAGIGVFALLLAFMTSFIWAIEIAGADRVPLSDISDALATCGLRAGVLKYGLSPDKIKQEMLIKMDSLSWIWVDIKGTKAFVEVKERKPVPDIFLEDEPCNIIAERGGVIKRLLVKTGLPVVNEGDAVEKGDLIVSGILDSRFEGARLIHSTATAMAETWHESEEVFPLQREERAPTGRTAKRRAIEICGVNFRLWLRAGEKFSHYDEQPGEYQLKLWGDFYLPIKYKTAILHEVSIRQVDMEAEEAAAWFAAILRDRLMGDIEPGIEIRGEKIEFAAAEGGISVKLTILCTEDIGKKVRIDE